MADLLEIFALSRHFWVGDTEIKALDGVTVSLAQGKILGIVGESGCGKSTLARLVMALDRPTSGQVNFDGENLFHLRASALRTKRRDFQMVFQDPYRSLDPRQTVERIVSETLPLRPDAPKGAMRRDMVCAVLKDVGLKSSDRDRYPHEFSGGQRQRIAIARAILTKPRLLVADEATSSLDVTVQKQILDLLLRLRDKQGLSVLFITHNMGVVEEICDEVAVLQRGKLVETGPVHDILNHPKQDYTQQLLSAEPTLDVIGRKKRYRARSS